MDGGEVTGADAAAIRERENTVPGLVDLAETRADAKG